MHIKNVYHGCTLTVMSLAVGSFQLLYDLTRPPCALSALDGSILMQWMTVFCTLIVYDRVSPMRWVCLLSSSVYPRASNGL